jgi:hypothetical protein
MTDRFEHRNYISQHFGLLLSALLASRDIPFGICLVDKGFAADKLRGLLVPFSTTTYPVSLSAGFLYIPNIGSLLLPDRVSGGWPFRVRKQTDAWSEARR